LWNLDIIDNATIEVSKEGEVAFDIAVNNLDKVGSFESNFTLGDYLAQNLKDTGVFDVIIRGDGKEIANFKYVSFSLVFQNHVLSIVYASDYPVHTIFYWV
jgi:hypothetical protein